MLKRINADFDGHFGLHCDVTVPGVVHRGDAVRVEPAAVA